MAGVLLYTNWDTKDRPGGCSVIDHYHLPNEPRHIRKSKMAVATIKIIEIETVAKSEITNVIKRLDGRALFLFFCNIPRVIVIAYAGAMKMANGISRPRSPTASPIPIKRVIKTHNPRSTLKTDSHWFVGAEFASSLSDAPVTANGLGEDLSS